MNNGFYAAMKTDSGMKAVYIDEDTFRRAAAQDRREERKMEAKKNEAARTKALRRFRRATVHLLKQEAKLAGMGLILWLGQRAGLVDLLFAAPVLICFQTVICFRAGRYWGRWGRKLRSRM